MGLGFGLLSAQLRPGETDWDRAYDETVRLAVEAERLGFGSVWTTEHHFVDDGYMPSLAVVSAAIAAATSEIEIGTGVLLAPMHDPIRLAEDAATVSLLSKGRFILGLGLGWSEVEFAALGVDRKRRGAAMEEILQILPQAFTGEPFLHAGSIYDLPELAVRPAPTTKIPVLVGGGAEAAIRRAARLADGIFANVPREGLLQQIEWIKDECGRIGRDPAELRIIHYSVMLPGSSSDDAVDRYLDHLWQMYWKYKDMEASAARPGPPPPAPPFDQNKRGAVYGRSTIAGTGEDIVETLNQIKEDAGLPVEFAARSYFHTLDYDDQIELMQFLASEVAPHV
jgi:probable F420-dependent oxidoreductase